MVLVVRCPDVAVLVTGPPKSGVYIDVNFMFRSGLSLGPFLAA